MSRRNPTKPQRVKINQLMKTGLSYEEAFVKAIPVSKPNPQDEGKSDPELTNIPKNKTVRKKDS